MSQSRRSGCFKYGCVGCLSLFALLIGLSFLLGAVKIASEHEPEPEERRVEHPLPQPASGPTYPGDDHLEVPPIAPLAEASPTSPPAIGRVSLDVSMADLEIVPGEADEPIRLEAEYDKAGFDLEERLTQDDDGGWLYELDFEPRGGSFGFLIGSDSGHSHNRLRLIVPRGHPFDLVGRISTGETEADLGGLWLGRVDLELGIGDHFIEFREPTPVPAELFRLKGKVGEVEVRGLGNASPRTVDVAQRIGEMTLDLEGAWQRDAEIDLELTIGEMRVWLPRTARVDLRQARVRVGEKREKRRDLDLPADAPTLTVRARGTIGDLRIDG